MTAAGLAMSAASMIGGGMAQKQQADYQAKAMQAQAEVENARAVQASEQAASQITKFDRQAAQLRGQQNAQMAASGLNMNSGSLMDIAVDTAGEQAIDRQNLAFQGKINQLGFENSANALTSQASMSRISGNNAMLGGVLSAGGSILGGAGDLYGKYRAGDTLDKLTAKAGRADVMKKNLKTW
jgi:hypothetical protein